MELSCNREPFKPGNGCPSINVDLTFPDFEACETLDPSRLKGVARLDLQKAPVFNPIIHANDSLPVQIPDIDFGCALDGLDTSTVTIEEGPPGSQPSGKLEFQYESGTCTLHGVDLTLEIPQASFAFDIGLNSTGGMSLVFKNMGASFFL